MAGKLWRPDICNYYSLLILYKNNNPRPLPWNSSAQKLARPASYNIKNLSEPRAHNFWMQRTEAALSADCY